MTNRLNFSDHQMLPGNVAFASMATSLGATLSIVTAPTGNGRIKVLSAGLNVNGATAVGVKVALTDGTTQIVIGAFGNSPGDRIFTHGWDLPRATALSAFVVDVQSTPAWWSLNVEFILITD